MYINSYTYMYHTIDIFEDGTLQQYMCAQSAVFMCVVHNIYYRPGTFLQIPVLGLNTFCLLNISLIEHLLFVNIILIQQLLFPSIRPSTKCWILSHSSFWFKVSSRKCQVRVFTHHRHTGRYVVSTLRH